MHNRRLSIVERKLWCHWLDHDAYTKVKDMTTYAVES